MMKHMVLLGAGASIPADVPAAYEMTKEIMRTVEGQGFVTYAHILRFVVGGLMFQAGIRNEDPFRGVDVEDLFNAVLLLADRHSLEAAPFIGSWHTMVERLDGRGSPGFVFGNLMQEIVRGTAQTLEKALPSSSPAFAENEVDRAIERAIEAKLKGQQSLTWGSHSPGKALRQFLSKTLNEWFYKLRQARPGGSSSFASSFTDAIQHASAPGEGHNYRSLASTMTHLLSQIVWVEDPSRTKHLEPLALLSRAQGRLAIATLNYDNCVELMCDHLGVPLEHGLRRWVEDGVFNYDDSGVFLLKLHGSIDWALESRGSTPERPMPRPEVRVIPAEQVRKQGHSPAVVFGHRNKLTTQGPFLDLLFAFRRELESSDQLTIVGYSFRDEHVNEFIAQWLNDSAGHRLVVVDPAFESSHVRFARELMSYCKAQLRIIPKPCESGLAEAFEEEAGPAVG